MAKKGNKFPAAKREFTKKEMAKLLPILTEINSYLAAIENAKRALKALGRQLLPLIGVPNSYEDHEIRFVVDNSIIRVCIGSCADEDDPQDGFNVYLDRDDVIVAVDNE